MLSAMTAEPYAMSDKAISCHPWLVPDDALIGQNTQCELNELVYTVNITATYQFFVNTDCQDALR